MKSESTGLPSTRSSQFNLLTVMGFSRYFYQYTFERLPTCVLTTHAWIHVPDFMEKSGPLWAFWCWVMERCCARLVRGVSSKKHPNASLDRRALEYANLGAIVNANSLQEVLPTFTRIYATSRTTSHYVYHENYTSLTLRTPTRTVSITPSNTTPQEMVTLRHRIAVHFSARWGPSARDILGARVLPSSINIYSRLQIGNGDTIRSFFGGRGEATSSDDSRRDATFFEYSLYVDRYAHQPRRRSVFVRQTYFGRLNRIIVIECAPFTNNPAAPRGAIRPFVLLEVDPCKVTRDKHGFYEYSTFNTTEVVDASTAIAVVGRVPENGKWVFVRRDGVDGHAGSHDAADELDGDDFDD